MECGRWGDWSYNQEANYSSQQNEIVYVKNNEGKQMLLKSITLYLGKAASNTSANWGNYCTGNGNDITIYLSTSYNGSGGYSTDSKTINSPTRGIYYSSDGTKRTYKTNDMTQYTFNFSGDGVLMNNNTTLYFHYIRSGSNTLVCPRDGRRWTGVDYQTQNPSCYAVEYNPYTAFNDISFSSINPIYGRYNDTNYTATYSITGGTNNLTSVKARLFNASDGHLKDFSFGNNKGTNLTNSFKVDTGGTGWHYRVSIWATDNITTKESGKKDIYTYVMPTVSALTLSAVNLTGSKFSPQDNAYVTYTTNGRKWINGEVDFTTKCTINGSTFNASSQKPTNSNNETNVSESSTESLSASVINSKYSATARSVKVLSDSITIQRINTSANSENYKVSSSKSFEVQYQPTKVPTSVSIKADGNSLPTKIVIQDTLNINLSWGYPSTSGAAGVVNGYYVEVFTNSSYTGTPYKTYNVSNNNSTGSKTLSTATDLKRGVMNYLKITPYYTCPDTSVTASYIDANHNIRGTQSYTSQLCIPTSRINTPVISYPVNNSTWHNKYFRVLLELPEDPDYNELINDRTIISGDAYRYQNIQLEITYPDNTTKTYNTSTTAVWSTTTFSYKKKIAICPALSSLNDVASYKMRIRVQKNYYITTGDESWSKWSSYVTVKKKAVSRQTYTKGQKIEDDHYMNPRTASVNCHGVYPLHSLPTNNISRSAGDKIEHKHYKGIYDTIIQIKNDVNGYCIYDNANVSFNRTINNFTNNPPKVEYITAADSDSIVSTNDGRNYMNLLVDDLNLLY